jgi:hypothetical protein
MADIPQVIATYDALVGVALGAGLTYGLGALNRRQQEAREDRTRWYEKRLQAYADLSAAAFQGLTLSLQSSEDADYKEHVANLGELKKAVSLIRLVGSPEVFERAKLVMEVLSLIVTKRDKRLGQAYVAAVDAFEEVARKDLGHP